MQTGITSRKHTQNIDRAIRAARLSNCRFTLGAVVVKGGSVLSVASNRWRNDPRQVFPESSFHAEVAALMQVSNPVGTTLYVARVGRLGQVTMARPCASCRLHIFSKNVRRVIYTDWNGCLHIDRVTEDWVLQ